MFRKLPSYLLASYLLTALLAFQPLKLWALNPGETIPDVSIQNADAKSITLSQYKGKVLYLDFWASWCSSCKESMKFLREMQQKYQSQGFEVVGINLDKKREDADTLLSPKTSNFTILYDPEGAVAEKFALSAMPSSILVDKTGKVSAVYEGFCDSEREKIESAITGLLKN